MKYKVSVVKTIALLMMTMALAVAMVACTGAVGPAGPPGPPGPTPGPTEPTPTPTPTPSENMAPTVSTIPPQTMMIGGDPLAVDVSPFFTDPDGDALIFSDAASSDPMVATVALSGSTLTITAVAAGESTISVTATDPGGLYVKGMVMLTVSDPDTADVIIEGVEKKEPVTIGEDQILVSADPNIASVARVAGSMTDWEVKGVKKGSTTLRVEDAQGGVVDTMKVEVGNTAPTVKTANTGAYYTLTAYPATTATAAYSVAIPGLARFYHSLEWDAMVRESTTAKKTNIWDLFTDKDGDSLTLTAMSESPDVKLVAIITASGMLIVDVIRFQGASFNIVVTADDGDGGTVSEELSVQTVDPIGDSQYKIRQLPNKDLAPVKVYQRHAAHLATFTTSANVDFADGELAFATDAVTNALNASKAPKGYQVVSGAAYPAAADMGTPPPTVQAAGFHITVKDKSGPINSVKFADPDGDGGATARDGLSFKVSGSGTAVIEITTHAVHAKKDAFSAADGITETAFNALPDFTTVKTMKTITLNIVKVGGANTITS